MKLAALAEKIGATFGVTDVTDTSALFKAARGAGGRLRGLAYCVRSITPEALARLEESDFVFAFRINALGAASAVPAERFFALPGIGHDSGSFEDFLLQEGPSLVEAPERVCDLVRS